MGYEIHFDDGTPESADYVFAFGSATDLAVIRGWVKASLPVDVCPRLHELVDAMTTTNTMELGAELEAALEHRPPPEGVRPILANLLERIGVGDEGETATIGDDFPQGAADRAACEGADAAGERADDDRDHDD